ncbi:MAG: hypothetical protein M3416_18300, partial [Acidobacteriota bacterium]|nr:hypothetical protein [Acidobacteriota bacterium]
MERQSKGVARGLLFRLSVVCLVAFFAFGNAVSAFGKTAAANSPNSRRKGKAAKSRVKGQRPAAAAETAQPDAGAQSAPELQPQARTVFRKVGEPFLVSAFGAQTQATPP